MLNLETEFKSQHVFVETRRILSHHNETLNQMYIVGVENILIYDYELN